MHGGNHGNQYTVPSEKVFNLPNAQHDNPSNQKELAESYGITQQTMNNYMRMASMIPELEDLVDTGILAPTTALAMMQSSSMLWTGCLLINYLLKICLLVKNLL